MQIKKEAGLMALFWIVHQIEGQPCVRIQEGGALIFAQLNAMIDGFGGSFVEAHALDAKTAKKIPKGMTGHTLTMDEAAALLDRLA
jgi:hypothetical protein